MIVATAAHSKRPARCGAPTGTRLRIGPALVALCPAHVEDAWRAALRFGATRGLADGTVRVEVGAPERHCRRLRDA